MRGMRFNKKGAEMGTKQIVMAIIAVIVLVAVVWALYSYFSTKGLPFFKSLPEFNQTKPPVVGIEILGYSFNDNKVKYYDGNEWVDFRAQTQSAIELNEKKIVYDSARADFTRSAFFSSRKEITLAGKDKMVLQTFSQYVDQILSKWGLNGLSYYGNMFAVWTGVFSENEKTKGFEYICVLKLDDSLVCSSEKPAGFETYKNSLKMEASAWRNELLTKPVQFSYRDTKQNVDKTIYVCGKILKTSTGYYFVLDLSKPVKQTDVCNV